jgi:hypothetical protein
MGRQRRKVKVVFEKLKGEIVGNVIIIYRRVNILVKIMKKHKRITLFNVIWRKCVKCTLIFLIGIVGGGVQLGPLGTAATNRPIVPTPDDYDDGEISGTMIGKRNRNTRRKPAPVQLCPPQIHMT